MFALAFSSKPENCIEEIISVPNTVKTKKFNYEKVFEVRPSMDGGTQGKSPLPYFMDDDGDVANEFYEEVNHKLVKVSESKLKQI